MRMSNMLSVPCARYARPLQEKMSVSATSYAAFTDLLIWQRRVRVGRHPRVGRDLQRHVLQDGREGQEKVNEAARGCSRQRRVVSESKRQSPRGVEVSVEERAACGLYADVGEFLQSLITWHERALTGDVRECQRAERAVRVLVAIFKGISSGTDANVRQVARPHF